MKVKGIHITLDNKRDMDFDVLYENKIYHFAPFEHGHDLYYFDTRQEPRSVEANINDDISPYSFLQTVDDNKQYYTDCEIKGAEKARLLQEELGWPRDTTILSENLITNS